MSFPKYPTYSESCLEWIGSIPNSWSIVRLSSIASVVNGFPFNSELFDPEEGMPLMRIRDLNLPDTEVRYRGAVVEAALITNEDVLIGMDGDFNVGRWRGDGPALLNQRMCCIRGDRFVVRLLEYALPRQLELINDLTYSTTVKHLSSGQIRHVKVPLPPTNNERFAILTFLDREVGKIDALVAEQERLIALLQEKRQAVISQAVTKGLNSKAPMKPSGVEWLGYVPRGWTVAPVSARYDVQLGRMLNEERSTGPDMRPYLRVFDVQWGKINVVDLPEMDFPELARERYALAPGDLLVNEGGSYVGRSAIWRGELEECFYQKALHRLRPRNPEQDTAEYLCYVMEYATKQGVFVYGGNQTTIDHLTAEQLRRYRFAFPPRAEQLMVVEYLNTQVAQIEALTTEAERLVQVLRERRSALISAAVTGKIDVRNLVELPTDQAVAA